MLDIGLEFIVLHARLVQLQVELQESDVGGIKQLRAMAGIGTRKTRLAERGGAGWYPQRDKR